jgi:pyrophosphatase PpaX
LSRPFALLFDLDGTLIDSIELLLRSARHAFSQHPGPGPTDAEWIAGIGTPLVSQLREWARTEEELTALRDSYRTFQHTHHDALTRCFDDVRETIQLLRGRGHPIAVVTSKMDDMARRSLSWVDLSPDIDLLVAADATTRHKPDPEPVQFALSRLGYGPGEAAFVGDSPHDIAAGNAAGVISVAATWGPFSRETLTAASPRFLIQRISELPPLLDRLENATIS